MRLHLSLAFALAASFLATASTAASEAADEDRPIRTRLYSAFAAPPLALEIAEGVAAHNSSAYFPFILRLAASSDTLGHQLTDADVYAQSLQWIEQDQLLEPFALSLLKLELSAHVYAPVVVAQYQLYNQTVVPDIISARGEHEFDSSCAVWAQYKDKQLCSVDALTALLDSEKFYGSTYVEEAKIVSEQLAFDHVYPASNGPRPSKLVVLYSDPRSDKFSELHSHLAELAENSEVTYILRYRPGSADRDGSSQHLLGLSGYGVELALKSTEYKVIDDRDLEEDGKNNKGASKVKIQGENEGNERLSLFAAESVPSVKRLSEKQVASIGIQAAQMILSSADKIETLKQLSQNLPRYAHLLSGVELNDTFAKSIRSTYQSSSRNLFLVNGLEIEDNKLDPFHLLEHLRKENAAIDGLENIGLSQAQAVGLLLSESSSQDDGTGGTIAFDMRDPSTEKKTIWWLNDLEKDKRYASWPTDIENLKRIATPGMVQRVRKNVVQAIYALDLSSAESWITVYEDAMTSVEHGLPMQYGVVPLVDYDTPEKQTSANEMAKLVLYLRRSFKKKEWQMLVRSALVSHLRSQRANPGMALTSTMRTFYEAHIKTHNTKDGEKPLEWDDITTPGRHPQWLAKRWSSTIKYCARLDLSPVSTPEGLAFINGVQIELDRNSQRTVLNTYFKQTWELGAKLRKGDISPEDSIQELVYGKNAVESRSSLVYVTDNNPLRVLSLNTPSVQKWMDTNVFYLGFSSELKGSDSENGDASSGDAGIVSTWIVGDFSSQSVRQTAANALLAAKHDRTMRIALMHVPFARAPESEYREDGEEVDETPEDQDIDAPQVIFQLISSSLSRSAPGKLADFVQRYLEDPESAQSKASDAADIGDQLATLVVPQNDRIDEFEQAFAKNVEIISTLGATPADQNSCNIIANGRIIPEIAASTSFSADSFAMLAKYELHERIAPLQKSIADYISSSSPDDVADRVLRSTAAFEHGKAIHKSNSLFRKAHLDIRSDMEATMTVNPDTRIVLNDPSSARLRIQVAVDPLSEAAQKWAPMLQTLLDLPGVSLEIWLNPSEKLKELPVKRFYRYLWPEKLSFDSMGALSGPEVLFSGVPTDPLLTLGMDVPSSWLVTAVESVHDLDNIRLSSLKDPASGITATYKLVNILVEGHLVDTNAKSPARGLEVCLGTSINPAITDTIVMANLGYLQLKAGPGVWKFTLRPGRSTEVYKLDHIGSGRWNYAAAKQADPSNDCKTLVLVTSFNGATIFPLVSKRPGKESEDVLDESDDTTKAQEPDSSSQGAGAGGLWGKLKSSIGQGANPMPSKDDRPHFDVFAVASGHLYERLMSIMILSVLNSTDSHVKFWLIENFLSPSFKAFVPQVAEEYGFDYEFVTYKWPHWLNHETEKQRTIWGYKILFLDVLFPLNLSRVIFVDADQIVRADLQELADMDLHGAPYGFTPFCDDREEIDGFRFWKQGWWKDHLRGKPYHISALYVVDLKRFRQLAAGDRMRGQYQALSSDGNSLANLDQDLPNNMQHVVPIHSLPQEWLWCETWCSDEGLKKAKTIDLCNNPMTKEPKLERARRLLPEWEVYDKQIANFTRTLAKRGRYEGAQIADAEAVVIDKNSEKDMVEQSEKTDSTDAATSDTTIAASESRGNNDHDEL
ncbi:killer toxin resistant protein [Coemansia sp. RSA 986]|nr:killer toxin resistant protein [Coemansia sp. RSA 986]